MRMVRRAAAAVVTMAFVATMVWASQAPLTLDGGDAGVLRLAWSARPERIETCRPQAQEELARLPVHMRQPVVCEGTSAQYRLTVRAGDEILAEQIVRGGGLRRDRRLYVFREFRLAAGEAPIEVRFERVEPPPPAAASRDAAAGATSPPPGIVSAAVWETVPPKLVFAGPIEVRTGEVVLITYSPGLRALVSKRPAGG